MIRKMLNIDLNCDLGESFGAYRIGSDAAIMPYISSANIACGFHAGDPAVMREAVRLCAANNVAVGAHPGLPDLQGFGRRSMTVTPREAYDLMLYQIGALQAFTKAEGIPLCHVKPHGALYHMAAKDAALAHAIAAAIRSFDPALLLYGLAGSELIHAGRAAGLATVSEVFADRTYRPDGALTPRGEPGAVIEEEDTAVAQVLQMLRRGTVRAKDGSDVPVEAQTVCLHGDGAHAVSFAKLLRSVLEADGIRVCPPSGKFSL